MLKVLRSHNVRLSPGRVILRPMTEDDWPTLLRWNQDPRVLAFWDTGNSQQWTLPVLQEVYRGISEHAWMFIIERSGAPIGEAWVQEMNLKEVRAQFPGKALYRIDISLGEPELWGQGLGSESIGALARFAFEHAGADGIFACHVAEENRRSTRAFEKNGFSELPDSIAGAIPTPRGARHLVRWRR